MNSKLPSNGSSPDGTSPIWQSKSAEARSGHRPPLDLAHRSLNAHALAVALDHDAAIGLVEHAPARLKRNPRPGLRRASASALGDLHAIRNDVEVLAVAH